jgi:uroporphyrin-III C-methyltransferase
MSGRRRDGVRRIRPRGLVWLVGAGPGDPALLTVKADRLVREARVLAYDELVDPRILALAPSDAERIPVGRRAGGCRHHEARIHPLVIVRALEGKDVVRLKGGDPLVFGRGGEEAEELAAARVPFEIVPGISAALAAAAEHHIPLTHRELASQVTFATAHAAGGAGTASAVERLPREGTVVLYMGLGRLRESLEALVRSGRPARTPAALVSRASRPDRSIVTGTLGTLAALVERAGTPAPAVVIVGEVVAAAVASGGTSDESDESDETASLLRTLLEEPHELRKP